MNWFQQNRWLGSFLIIVGVATLLSAFFLWRAHNSFEKASASFNEAATERNRLENLDPLPNDANYQKMKVHIENYGAAVEKMKEDLKTRMLPIVPLQPNEFQSRLRQVTLATFEKARLSKVKLPLRFHLGFDEFTASLPSTAAAPLLSQQLSQIASLMNILIDARVDSVTALHRTPLAEERGAAPPATPIPGRTPGGKAQAAPKLIERHIVDLTFVAAPSVARKVLNQIASSTQQFYIIRALHMRTLDLRNEKETAKGPPREPTSEARTGGKQSDTSKAALRFIVGNEHIETSARIEMMRFTF
jgi:hypothetical protein